MECCAHIILFNRVIFKQSSISIYAVLLFLKLCLLLLLLLLLSAYYNSVTISLYGWRYYWSDVISLNFFSAQVSSASRYIRLIKLSPRSFIVRICYYYNFHRKSTASSKKNPPKYYYNNNVTQRRPISFYYGLVVAVERASASAFGFVLNRGYRYCFSRASGIVRFLRTPQYRQCHVEFIISHRDFRSVHRLSVNIMSDIIKEIGVSSSS